MKTPEVPKYVLRILRRLEASGHEAYLVGGCVRDMLRGRRPQDWDLCSSARPEELLALFPRSLPTGLRHGTVTVRAGGRGVEVTTWRSEGAYSDHRHPDSVRFVDRLETDLSRRDFTFNAMALSADGVLVDPFGGRRDLARGLIRCVGEPGLRFEEDALRMLRALRFAARFGFCIERGTLSALREKAPLAASLAPERVREELSRLLASPRPETVALAIGAGLLDAFLRPVPPPAEALRRLARLPRRTPERWAGLCVLLLRAGAIADADAFLTALRADNETRRCCAACARMLEDAAPARAAEWKRLLRRHGTQAVLCAARCRDALDGGTNCRALRAVLESGDCWEPRSLAVGGRELGALGLEGRALGAMLERLLDHVIERPGDNDRRRLLALAAEWRDTPWTAGKS